LALAFRFPHRYNGFDSEEGDFQKRKEGLMEQGVAEQGQGMVEYALVLILVAVALVAALGVLGVSISGLFQLVVSQVPDPG
jgi:pilus assembly protein Flp/PilA